MQNRQFHVSGGIITGLSGLGNHNTGLDVDHGATTGELCPFNDTPNPGGVYKAWVTPVSQFRGNPANVDNSCGNGCFHGFVPAFSKTDNFKVKGGAPGACLEVLKIVDVNGNGVGDIGEDPLINWPVTVFDPLGASNTFWTPTVKECTFAQLVPGLYRVVEPTVATFRSRSISWTESTLRDPDTTVLVRIKNNATRVLVFGNAPIQ